MDDIYFLIDLMTRRLFSNIILPRNLKKSLIQKSGLVQNNWSLKLISYGAFLGRIKTMLILRAHIIQKQFRGESSIVKCIFLN